MLKAALAGVLAFCAGVVPAAALDVPSGQTLSLQEVLIDTVGAETWLRFRFVAPEIERGGDYEVLAGDMLHLCDETALPYMAQFALEGDVVVISIADRETEFGVADPDAVQFFEAFRTVDNACMWEDL